MSEQCCSQCRIAKPLAAFHANGAGRWRSACKDCERLRDSLRRPAKSKPPKLADEDRRQRARERDRKRRAAAAALRPPKVKKPSRTKVGRMGPAPSLLVLDGVALSRSQWADRLGLAGRRSIIAREDREWSHRRTLSQPVVFHNQRHAKSLEARLSLDEPLTFEGATRPLRRWAEVLGCTPQALRGRLKLGWSVERTLSTPIRKYRECSP